MKPPSHSPDCDRSLVEGDSPFPKLPPIKNGFSKSELRLFATGYASEGKSRINQLLTQEPPQDVPTPPRTVGAPKLREALSVARGASQLIPSFVRVAFGSLLVGLGFTLAATIGFYTLDWLFCVTHPGVC